MDKFKGTQGKWYIGEHRATGIQIGCSQSHYVACAYSGGNDRTDDELLANAQLIAAAPELLKTLQGMQLSIMAHPDYVSGENQEFIDKVDIAQEVIDKALGINCK